MFTADSLCCIAETQQRKAVILQFFFFLNKEEFTSEGAGGKYIKKIPNMA